MKRTKFTAVVLATLILFTLVVANKPQIAYADEVEETVVEETASEETTAEETATEETAEETIAEEEVEEEVVTDEASDAAETDLSLNETVPQYLENIDITVDPGFVRTIFNRNENISCVYDGSSSQEGYRYTASDINNAVSITPVTGPVFMTYHNELVSRSSKYLDIEFEMTAEMLLRITAPNNMNSLNITVNGVKFPLTDYQFRNDYNSDYFRFRSDELKGCSVVFAHACLILLFDEDFVHVDTVDMYRLYNPNSGEHFFTASAGERDSLVAAGWSNEGIGWKAPVTSNTPVYRLYNQNGGEHHYTTSASERDFLVSNGWSDEGIGWYSDDYRGVPVYRQYNPNSFANNHNYSTSASENDWLVSLGWKSEGIAWYGVA